VVDPPRPRRTAIEKRCLEIPEAAKLVEKAREENSRLHTPILLAWTTGMRRSEILALSWEELDLENSRLRVRRSLEQTRDGLNFKSPKSESGKRVISLPALTVEALRKHRISQAEEKLALGSGYSDEDLVFATSTGKPWRPNTFTTAFRDFAKRAGMGKTRFHDLRHSHASQLLDQGENLKVIQERLGHSTPAFTLSVYGHSMAGRDKEAATKINESLRVALGE
jgi:integrase